MADVNLEVAVASTGVANALTNLTNMQEKGLATGKAFDLLAEKAQRAGTIVQRAMGSGQVVSFDNQTKAITRQASALAELEAEYSRLAKLNPNQSASQRLANNLGANPAANLNRLATLRDAQNATVLGDQMAVAQQKAEALAASLGKAAAETALADAVWGTYAGQLTAAERAQDSLTQAQLRYAEAQKATVAATPAAGLRVAAGLPGAGSFRGISAAEQNALNRAIQEEAAALNNVTRAQNELAAAETKQAGAARESNQAQNDANSNFGYFKYLAIASAAERAAQAVLGIGEAAVTAQAQQDRAFADVTRTSQDSAAGLANLRQAITELSTVSVFSFSDLAEIAALGNQLGVAAADIESFTKTVSEFSLVSGQTADVSATQFGKIGNLTGLAASQYSNLGSSIEYVARTTAATESSIANTSKEIAALASGAGFSADAIVGLSGALSSLSIPPERARGALSLYFGALNSAVAEGGPKLAAFAELTGKTTDEITRLVESNRGQEVFTSFISGLSQLNTVAKTTALSELGLSTIRVDQTMRALSQNVPLLTSSLAGASTAFNANTELARQNETIQKTLVTRYAEFQHAVENAASAVGGAFAPALLSLLKVVTDVLVGIERFVQTPIGQAFAIAAGAVGLLVVALLAGVGAFATFTAAQKVVPWAFTALGAKEASNSLTQFVAGLLGVNLTIGATNGEMTVLQSSFQKVDYAVLQTKTELLALPGVMEAVAIGESALSAENTALATTSRAASAGFTTMRAALVTTGIGIAVVALGALVNYVIEAGNAAENAADQAKDFLGDFSSIGAALKKDQSVYLQTGSSIQTIGTHTRVARTSTDDWVSALQDATGAQVSLGDGTQTTTNKIDRQTIAYGDNARAALGSLLANSKKFQSLFADTKANAALAAEGFNTTDFTKALLGDPINGGKKYVARLTSTIAQQYGLSAGQLQKVVNQITPGIDFSRANKGASNFNTQLLNQGIHLTMGQLKALQLLAPEYSKVVGAANSTATAVGNQAKSTAGLVVAQQTLNAVLNDGSDGFVGATSSLADYQDAIQSGLSTVLGFSTILSQVTDAAGKNSKLINAQEFGKDLSAANDSAVTFFNGIQQLAASGNTSFATQLAALGPAAQGVLSSALAASPETQTKLEEDARFAAFLASDEFKKAFASDMQNSDANYARILAGGGTLDDVKSYIAAQATGGAEAWEKAWDLAHPTAPINVDFQSPTPEDLALFQAENDGKITVTAKVIPVVNPKTGAESTGNGNTFTDTTTGNSITLPATLDGKALSASLAYWRANEGATAEDIAAKLNTGGFNADIDAWRASHGPVEVLASVHATADSLAKLNAQIRTALGKNASLVGATGGRVGYDRTLKFATGGGYGFGQFQGGGTGTSDSLLARVSRGEFINTADATNYWGPDFFDSLNRKMLPSSIANMLQAAAVSGNSGPSHVAHVQIVQNNPLTKDPLKELRSSSEMTAAGIWGGS